MRDSLVGHNRSGKRTSQSCCFFFFFVRLCTDDGWLEWLLMAEHDEYVNYVRDARVDIL